MNNLIFSKGFTAANMFLDLKMNEGQIGVGCGENVVPTSY